MFAVVNSNSREEGDTGPCLTHTHTQTETDPHLLHVACVISQKGHKGWEEVSATMRSPLFSSLLLLTHAEILMAEERTVTEGLVNKEKLPFRGIQPRPARKTVNADSF